MTVWFNDATEKFSYAKAGGLIDGENTNSTVTFDEGYFRKSDDGKVIDCFLHCTSLTDVKKAKANDWNFSPTLLYFQLHSEQYEKPGYGEKAATQVTPNPFTVWLFKSIDDLMAPNKDVRLKGSIMIIEPSGSITATQVMSRVGANGKPLSDEAIDFLTSNHFSFEVIETLSKVDIEKLPTVYAGGYKSGGKSYGQSEAAKLKDRADFIIAHAVGFAPGAKDLGEVAVCLVTAATAQKEEMDTWLKLIELSTKG